jgi:hypothetical protein
VNQKAISELKKLTPPVGSYVLVIASLVVRVLQWFWLGIWSFTHIQRVYDSEHDISAESSGVKLVDRIESLKGAKRVVIYRANEKSIILHFIPFEMRFQDIADKYLNTKYDFWFYVLVAMRIFLFFIPIVSLILSGNFTYLLGFLVVCLIIYVPLNRVLHNLSDSTWACAELSNALDCDLGVPTGIPKEMSFVSSPWQIKCMCESRGDEVLFDSGWYK